MTSTANRGGWGVFLLVLCLSNAGCGGGRYDVMPMNQYRPISEVDFTSAVRSDAEAIDLSNSPVSSNVAMVNIAKYPNVLALLLDRRADIGVDIIAFLVHPERLEILYIADVPLREQDINLLGMMPSLRVLGIERSGLDGAQIKRLKKLLRKTQIKFE